MYSNLFACVMCMYFARECADDVAKKNNNNALRFKYFSFSKKFE